MDKQNVFFFAGKCLEKYGYITPNLLSIMIEKEDSVAKVIKMEDIQTTLDLMVECGWIEIQTSDPINPRYKRFITIKERNDLVRRIKKE